MTPYEDDRFVSIHSGRDHSCALRTDGSVRCWGNNESGQLNVPQNEVFASIGSGASALHTCGLRHDESIACWGTVGGPYDYGQASPPNGHAFKSVSAGFAHTCAIRDDGRIVCWGSEDGIYDYGQSSPPQGHSHGFVSISSGWAHTCAVYDDGTPVCWGAIETAFDHGQASPPTTEKFVSLSSGINRTCAVRRDGSPLCWGNAANHSLAPPVSESFVSISNGRNHICGLRNDGNLLCWGAIKLDTEQLDQTYPAGTDVDAIVTPTPRPTFAPTATPTATLTINETPVPSATAAPRPTITPTPIRAPTPTATPPSSTTPTLPDMVESVRAGVVRIDGPSSSGTGFVVDAAGYILTNEHVIAGQSRLTVVFDNGTRSTPTVIASDAARDIALLKVPSSRAYTVLDFATSVRQAEEVVALGHPLDLGDGMTVTTGIVSAFRNFSGVPYIQTDAAINPGNSGGPLLNLWGDVVGMNTSSIDESTSGRPVEGIGFAIKFDALEQRLAAMKSGAGSVPTPTPSAVSTTTTTYTFGPRNGSIDHDPDDGFIDTYRANITVGDAVIEARFLNPYATSEGDWDGGFLFRHTSRNTFHVIVISSDGWWYHRLRTGEVATTQKLASEYSQHIDTTSFGSNHLRIVTRGSDGWLFINGHFVGELALGGLTDSGDVYAVGSYFRGRGIVGKSTKFEDFTVRSLRQVYGPRDGEVDHDPGDGFIDEYLTYTSIKDGFIEGRFSNPYAQSQGDWSNGFIFRGVDTDSFHALVIEEDGYWNHRLRFNDTEDTMDLATRYSGLISTDSGSNNHIRIIALGNEGWLFINETFLDRLDLSELNESGEVSAVVSYFKGDGLAGYSTRFENFTIWSADGR